MCVPFTGSEAWTRSMGYKIVDEWRAWTSNGQIAGYFHYLFLFSFFFSRSRFLEFNTKEFCLKFIRMSFTTFAMNG